MTNSSEVQLIGSKLNKIMSTDIKVLDDLLRRTKTLPDILHLRAAEIGYELSDEDTNLVMDTYSKLDDILKEVAAFINVKFPGCERHVRAWNAIDFDTKIGPIKIITTDREHIKREWRKGIFDLISLIKVLRNETILLVNEKEDVISIQSEAFIRNNRLRSWLEVLSWIAGIVGTIVTLYALLK